MSAPEHSVPEVGPVACGVMVGRKWKAVVNGYRALNGTMYGATLSGTVERSDAVEASIYEVLGALAYTLSVENAEMRYVDSIQVTIFPPPNTHPRGSATS